MIIEVTRYNVDILDNSILEPKIVVEELNNNPYGHVLVLQEDNKIIGYIYYSDIYERAEINNIEIEKAHRNSGKGSKLLSYMISIVNKDITLEVNENNIAAINLYKKFNFKSVAVRIGYYDGIDGILMERKTLN